MRRTISFGVGVVVLFVSLTGALRAYERTPLDFEARVDAQRAVEEVFWRHRAWPPQNPLPKPPLDQVMTESDLRSKVEDYLEKSEALEVHGRRPISADQLQAEVERMTRETRQPEVLAELFAALGDDPFLIAECLARPALAHRLARLPVPGDVSGSSVAAPPTGDIWSAVTQAGAPSARQQATAVWTGAEMIVWGGVDALGNTLGSGGRYTPATNTWSPISGLLTPRAAHTAVWTGTHMIVWGGDTGTGRLHSGGRYDPIFNTWTPTSTGANVPTPRAGHSAVWTGSEMIIWGSRHRRVGQLGEPLYAVHGLLGADEHGRERSIGARESHSSLDRQRHDHLGWHRLRLLRRIHGYGGTL